jgi:hypothetical protein
MTPDEAAEVVTAARWADRVEQPGPGDVRVSAVDRLAGITPAMFAWWFATMDAETYRWFHPHDHHDFAWTRGKQPGGYVGATHRTHHRYGGTGPLLRTEITFLEPGEAFPPAALRALGQGHALAARVHPLDERDRPAAAPSGHFVHVVLPRPGGSELRGKWWLRVDEHTDLELVTTGRLRHVHEEFGFLQTFLPGLYDRRAH